jgi:DNA-binding NtrC family response regulator
MTMTRLADEPTRSFAWSSVAPDTTRVLVFWDTGSTAAVLEPGKALVVGRGDDCDVQVLHPSVSRRHAKIHGGPPIRLEDLGSSRGTRVDGELVGTAGVSLASGQIAELGGAMLLVQEPSAPTGTAATRPPSLAPDRLVSLVAKSQLSVLIAGETGSGKEVMAERIHRSSTRAAGPFVKINCAAFPEALLESELFGHERGAFTGALQTKRGLIEGADKGTLLLDEIGEMPPAIQAKVLRTLESREVRRVGAVESFTVDVRFLSATHRDLDLLVREGRFRQDLLFRLNAITIPVSPLREQPGRILTLARELLAQAEGGAPTFTREAEAALLRHSWPGNVRELRNVVERALVLAEGGPIDVAHLLLGHAEPSPGSLAPASLGDRLGAYERDQIAAALAEANGNQTRAAAALGMSRRALINRIEAYGLPRPRKPT